MDEVGLQIGCIWGCMFVTHARQRSAYIADSENRESVIIMETISAGGRVILLTALMQRAIFKKKLFITISATISYSL